MDRFDWEVIAEKAAYVLIILLVTWILARVVRWAVAKLVGRVKFLQHQGDDGKQVGDSIGQIAALLIWLFGLVAILQVFRLQEVISPLRNLLDGILVALPNIIGAALVFFIGFVIARIIKQLLYTALSTVNFDRLASKVKSADADIQRATGTGPAAATAGAPASDAPAQPQQSGGAAPAGAGSKIPELVSNVAFAIVMLVVAIASLQILGISAISEPGQQVLTVTLNAIPRVVGAAILLGLGYLIANFIGPMLESLLRGLGTDTAVAKLLNTSDERSASAILTRIAQVAIMVFFGVMAARLLDFPEVTAILTEVLSLGGRVLFGAAIIAAGFLIASVLAQLIGGGTAGTITRYATLVLFIAMGLQYMGIADSIINLAFGAVVVGGALAAALAYGLGGRDAAARSLEKINAKAQSQPPASDDGVQSPEL